MHATELKVAFCDGPLGRLDTAKGNKQIWKATETSQTEIQGKQNPECCNSWFTTEHTKGMGITVRSRLRAGRQEASKLRTLASLTEKQSWVHSTTEGAHRHQKVYFQEIQHCLLTSDS